jgi:hypothetical protein
MKKSSQITTQFRNSTITFENKKEALNFVEWFSFHANAMAQTLEGHATGHCEIEEKHLSELIFLNRDITQVINSILTEMEGDYE